MAGDFKNNKLNTNTSGVAFYNSDEGYAINSTLRCGYWNDRMTLSIYPKLEEAVEGKVFDYDKQMAAFLNSGDIANLIGIVESSFQHEDDEFRRAIPTSKGMVEFGTRNSQLNIDTPYINICETDEDKNVTSSMLYQFKPTVTIKDYSYEDASYSIERDGMGEVKQLLATLKGSEMALTNAFAHTVAEREKYAKEKVTNNIIKIMDKMGIPTEYTGTPKTSKRWDTATVATANKSLPSETRHGDIDPEDIY